MDLHQKSRLSGVLGSTIFHAIVLLILLLYTLSQVVPTGEEGLAISLGDDELGGDSYFEPTPASEVATPAPPTPPAPTPSPAEEQLLTQDIEESLTVPEEKNKTKEDIEKEKKKIAEQKKRQQEIEERKRKEAEEKAKREAEEKIAKKAGEKVKNVFGGNGAGGTGNDQSSSGTGGGNSSGSKGNPFGSKDANSSEGNAARGGGSGNSWNLSGRKITSQLAVPRYNVQEEGKVVINIVVNKDGKVISAEVGRGTNTDNRALLHAAKEAAMKATFNAIDTDKNQAGTITYNFHLQ